MVSLRRNQINMKYSVLLGESVTYKTDSDGNIIYDSYTDSDGTVYHYPIETGSSEEIYSTPTDFMASFSMSGSDAEATEYGLSTADYEAVLSCQKGAYPIIEGALIWVSSEVESIYNEEVEIEIDGQTYTTIAPKKISADYTVIKSSTSLNEDRYILKAVNK